MNDHEVREDGTGRPIRLCFFAHLSDLGGAERTLLELVKQLIDDHGADCTVVAPGSGPLILKLEEAGARVLRTEYWWWCTADDLSPLEMQKRVGLGLARIILEILPQLDGLDPDVLCTETIVIPYGALAAAWLRKPHIWNIREYGEAGGFRFMMPWARIAAFMRDHSDFMFGVNRRICEELIPEIQPGEHDVLYPAIEAPASIKNLDRPTGGRSFRVCEFATIDRSRRLDIAIQAVAELARRGRDVVLTIAGRQHDGHAAELERLAQSLGVGRRVEIQGFLCDVFAAMAEHDALVISAPVHGLGRTAIEGMVCGIPVVYPRGTGFDDILDDEVTGLGYAAGDALAMADRLDALIQDLELRIALGRRARLRAKETFTKDGFSGKFLRKAVELAGRPRVTRADACTDLLESMARAVGDLERHAANLERTVSARDEEVRSLKGRHSMERSGAGGGWND